MDFDEEISIDQIYVDKDFIHHRIILQSMKPTGNAVFGLFDTLTNDNDDDDEGYFMCIQTSNLADQNDIIIDTSIDFNDHRRLQMYDYVEIELNLQTNTIQLFINGNFFVSFSFASLSTATIFTYQVNQFRRISIARWNSLDENDDDEWITFRRRRQYHNNIEGNDNVAFNNDDDEMNGVINLRRYLINSSSKTSSSDTETATAA